MPKRIYSWTYINEYVNTPSITPPQIKSADLLEVSRNGVGLLSGVQGSETLTADITKYERRSKINSVADAGKYVIEISVVNSLFSRTIVYEFGPTVTVGDTYRFEINPVAGVSYVVEPGDTANDVRNGIKTLIDASTFPFTFSTSSIGSDKLSITVNSITYKFKAFVIFGVKYLFQTGYYTTLLGKQFLITNQNNNSGYVTLPSVSASYNYNSLTYLPIGLIPFIADPLYVQDSYTETAMGQANITNFPTASSLGPGRYIYSETAQTLTFAEPLQPGEYIKVLYK